MADQQTLKRSFTRGKKALSLKPSLGQYTTVTKIKLHDGTTCDIEHGPWKFVADVGTDQGGNNAGPGPGILQRAALGTCLAVGYSTWAAVLDVPINSIEVEVEADVDALPMYELNDGPPGYKALRYRVTIDSPAPREEIMKVLDKADALSPVLDDFIRPIPVSREVKILTAKEEELNDET